MTDKPSDLIECLQELTAVLNKLTTLIEVQKLSDNQLPVKDMAVVEKHLSKPGDNSPALALQQMALHKRRKNYLRQWLQDKNIRVGAFKHSLHGDRYLASTAEYLADHYGHLKEFYKKLKANTNHKTDFDLTIRSKNAVEYIRNWCDMLEENHLIDGVEWEQNNRLSIDVAALTQAFSFINGNWLEILLRAEVSRYFLNNINRIATFDLLACVQMIKPNNKRTELDLLLMLDEDVYWFECKSGIIGTYYEKFEEHRNLLGLSPERSFLVIQENDDHKADQAGSISQLTTLAANRLEEDLKIYLKLY